MTDTAFPRATPTRYSTVAIVLHWLIAILLIFQVGLGLRMDQVHGSTRFVVFQVHKSVGITILLLVVVRLVWRFYRRPPPIAAKRSEKTLAHLVHALFYVLLFALPISGWIIISTSRIVVPTLLYGTIPWPDLPGFVGMATAAKTAWHGAAEWTHVNLVLLIYALFALHVAGALKHHFVDRDHGIARMAPGVRPGAWADPRLIAIAIGVVLAAGLGIAWLPIGTGKAAAPAQIAANVPEAARPVPTDAAPAPAPLSPIPTDAPSAIATPVADTAEQTDEVPSWRIASGSTLRFHTNWSGDAIDGGFTGFSGKIAFSPDHLDRSRAEITIDTGSAFSGDAQRDETLKSADWFSVAAFGSAIFKADRFRKTGTNAYVASGSLRLKGVTLPITLPFTLTITGDKAAMKGKATVDRTAYKIGEGDYASTAEIPAAVSVDITVNATRQK